MPQFAFSATDRMGNQVEGSVFAGDMALAADQVRQMGYVPVRVEAAGNPAATPAPQNPTLSPETAPLAVGANTPTATMPARPAPIDLTQPVTEMPAAANALLVPLNSDASDTTARMERLEPWQRGGPVPQPPPPKVSLNSYGAATQPTQAMAPPSPAVYQTTERAAVSHGVKRERVGSIPYGAGVTRDDSLWQRFKETMIYPIFAGVVVKDLAPFYRQFATLINAGLPIYQALVALESNTDNAKLKEIAHNGQAQVQAGGRFSDVMAAYPWVFQPMQIELVRAAEQGGLLDQVLLQIADYVEHELEIRRLISRETLYPKFVLFVALMILGRTGFTGGPLAVVPLVMTGNGWGYLKDTLGFGLLCLIPFIAVVATFRLFLFNVKGVREGYDTFKMSIPGLGKLVRMFALAKFGRTLAALYRGGFPLGSALQIAGDACGNGVFRSAAYGAVAKAERGELISDSLRATSVFPPMALDMIRTGETAGSMDHLLDKMADFYESEAKTKSHMVAVIFGVVVFLLVALMVGHAIITQYVGLANASTTLPPE